MTDPTNPAPPVEELRDYAAQSVADLRTECGKIAAEFPNWGTWDVSLPAGHWRALLDHLSSLTVENERLRGALASSATLRPEVLAFASLMEQQLRANDHKPGWKDDLSTDLLDRVVDELEELVRANGRHAKRLMWGGAWQMEDTAERVGKEAADVANFAMMVADVCGALTIPRAALSSLPAMKGEEP